MDKIITAHITLNTEQADVFEYFVENHLLESWLTKKADVEMKVGGKYELFWTPEDPDLSNNSTYGCKVLAVERPRFFTIEWMGNAEQKAFMNTVRPRTHVTILFSPLEKTVTRVTVIHTGWREGKQWESARQYFVRAWTEALEKLQELVNGTG